LVGELEGQELGRSVGLGVVGNSEGDLVGLSVLMTDGIPDGTEECFEVGFEDFVGISVGDLLGLLLGLALMQHVRNTPAKVWRH